MSLKSWKKEFYPETAKKCAEKGDVGKMIEHSLLKWIGLRPETLEVHRLFITTEHSRIQDMESDGYLGIDTRSCSLCAEFYQSNRCSGCPLLKVQGHRPWCLEGGWQDWIDRYDPEPMIKSLYKALEIYRRNA